LLDGEIEETVGAVVSVEEEFSVDADEPPSSLPHEIMVRLKRSTNKMCKILFIFPSISYERRRFEELLNLQKRLSIQLDMQIVELISFVCQEFLFMGILPGVFSGGFETV